jgi:hypothetical protein
MAAQGFGLGNGWREAKYRAEWFARGLRIALNGCEWPLHKKATIKWQLGDRAGQLKKLRRSNQRIALAKRKKSRRGNQGIAPAKRKIAAWQLMDCTGQKNKIAARQSWYCACLFKICGAAIRVLRRMVGARLEGHS